MTKIVFSASEVQNTISTLQETYTALEDKLTEINTKKGQMSQFWSAKEASRFNENLTEISQAFAKFKTKYDGYLAFLNSVITAYSADSTSFVATINSIAASAKEE